MTSKVFNLKQENGYVALKLGRRTYATVSKNVNPEYNWMLWLKGGIALSGFSNEQAAIDRAEQMHNSWRDTVKSLIK